MDELTWRDVFDGDKYSAGTHIDEVARIAFACHYLYMAFNGIIYNLIFENHKICKIDTNKTVMDLAKFQQLTPIKKSELSDEIERLERENFELLREVNFLREYFLMKAENEIENNKAN
jgi:hypothetical protein